MLARLRNPCIIEHMDNKETQMKLSNRTVELALFMLERDLDCYRSNLRRELYPDADQRAYVENLVEELETAVEELNSL